MHNEIKVSHVVRTYSDWDGAGAKVITTSLPISKDYGFCEAINLVKNRIPDYYSFEFMGQRNFNEKYLKSKRFIR